MFVVKRSRFLLNENLKQARQYLEKGGLSNELPEFKHIVDKLQKTPNLIFPFTKMLIPIDPDGDTSVLDIGNVNIEEFDRISGWILNNRNLVGKLPKNISEYQELEELSDGIEKVKYQSVVDKFTKSLYKEMRDQVGYMSTNVEIDNYNHLAYNFMSLSKEERDYFTPLKYFRINNISFHEFIESIKNFLDDKNINDSKESVLKYVEENKDKINVTYDKGNVLVLETTDGDTVCKLGSERWCIVYNPGSYQNQYFGEGSYGTQYIIYNFNLPSSNPNSMFGVTITPSGTTPYGGSQNKPNDYIPLKNIYEVTGIPEGTLKSKYSDLRKKLMKVKDRALSMLKKGEINLAAEYLTKSEVSNIIFKDGDKFGVKIEFSDYNEIVSNIMMKLGAVEFFYYFSDLLKDHFVLTSDYEDPPVVGMMFGIIHNFKQFSDEATLILMETSKIKLKDYINKFNKSEELKNLLENVERIRHIFYGSLEDDEIFDAFLWVGSMPPSKFLEENIEELGVKGVLDYILKHSDHPNLRRLLHNTFVDVDDLELKAKEVINKDNYLEFEEKYDLSILMESEWISNLIFKYYMKQEDVTDLVLDHNVALAFVKSPLIILEQIFDTVDVRGIIDNEAILDKLSLLYKNNGRVFFEKLGKIIKDVGGRGSDLVMYAELAPKITELGLYLRESLSKSIDVVNKYPFTLTSMKNFYPSYVVHYLAGEKRYQEMVYCDAYFSYLSVDDNFDDQYQYSPMIKKKNDYSLDVRLDGIDSSHIIDLSSNLGKIANLLDRKTEKLKYDVILKNITDCVVYITQNYIYHDTKGFENWDVYISEYDLLIEYVEKNIDDDNKYDHIFDEIVNMVYVFSSEEEGITEESVDNMMNFFVENINSYHNDMMDLMIDSVEDHHLDQDFYVKFVAELFLKSNKKKAPKTLSSSALYALSTIEKKYYTLFLKNIGLKRHPETKQWYTTTTYDDLKKYYEGEPELEDYWEMFGDNYNDYDYYVDLDSILNLNSILNLARIFNKAGFEDISREVIKKYSNRKLYGNKHGYGGLNTDQTNKLMRENEDIKKLYNRVSRIVTEQHDYDTDEESYKEMDIGDIQKAINRACDRANNNARAEQWHNETLGNLSKIFEDWKSPVKERSAFGSNLLTWGSDESEKEVLLVIPKIEQMIETINDSDDSFLGSMQYRTGSDYDVDDIIGSYFEDEGKLDTPYDVYYTTADPDNINELLDDELSEYVPDDDDDTNETVIYKFSQFESLNVTPKDIEDEYGDIEIAKKEVQFYTESVEKLNKIGGNVYRLIFLDDLSELRPDDLGDHWTFCDDCLRDFYSTLESHGEGHLPYIITAHIEPNSIDVDTSVHAFKQLPYEMEINLKINPINFKINAYKETDKALGRWNEHLQ